MIPAVNIGPLVLPTSPFILILGIWCCVAVAERSARSLGLSPESMSGLVTTGIVGGFIGARLVFVAQYWPSFQENLWSILWPLNAGYNLWGGLLFGSMAMLYYGRYKQLAPGPYLDALAPGLLAALMFVSLADFVGGPGFGEQTTAAWGVESFGTRRHPVQLYEIAAALAALGIWWYARPRRAYPGQLFLVATAVYAGGRLITDAYRANAWIVGDGWHGLQITALLVALVAVAGLLYLAPKSNAQPAATENNTTPLKD